MPPTDQVFIRNLIHFCRVLRGLGLPVGANRVALLIRAMEWIDLGQRDEVYSTCETVLLRRASDRELFRAAFGSFWEGEPLPALDRPQVGESPIGSPETAERDVVGEERSLFGAEDDGDSESSMTLSYSEVEVLTTRDFAVLTRSELAQVMEYIKRWPVRLDPTRSRRLQPGKIGRLDMRRSLRANLRHGGEWTRWMRQGHRTRSQPLVVFADISGSMERYGRVLIQFLLWLAKGTGGRAEVFLFGTRLTRVTEALKRDLVEGEGRQLSRLVPDWGGGTRIGPALREFNRTWARRILGRQSTAIVVSDGWDRGDPELLRGELARLARGVAKLIWLNPLLGDADYQPLTRGMQAALPLIDEFLPAHNLASLEDLLVQLDASRRGHPPKGTVIRAQSQPSGVAWP
jgi:uncharacterized protein with von Willebrand factor type A (vWA) domain